jgi:hypothetical protein
MTPTPITRDTVQARLRQSREALSGSIAGLTEAELQNLRVTPEWSALDILRHLWIWNELCVRCLGDWLGSRDWVITFYDQDEFNVEMVAARANADLASALGGIDVAYRYYTDVLTNCSETQLEEQAAAPWGQELSQLGLIDAEMVHDLGHIGQIVAAREAALC